MHGRLALRVVAVGLDTARLEWSQAHEQLEAAADDRRRYRALLDQIEVVLEELTRRLGQTFTLEQLADGYDDAERWAREAVQDRAPGPGWPRDLTLVLGAAFYRFQRGASDYEP